MHENHQLSGAALGFSPWIMSHQIIVQASGVGEGAKSVSLSWKQLQSSLT